MRLEEFNKIYGCFGVRATQRQGSYLPIKQEVNRVRLTIFPYLIHHKPTLFELVSWLRSKEKELNEIVYRLKKQSFEIGIIHAMQGSQVYTASEVYGVLGELRGRVTKGQSKREMQQRENSLKYRQSVTKVYKLCK
jgi:hypothetical protein